MAVADGSSLQYASMPRRSSVVALGLTVFFGATSLYIAAHRLLWFDEVLTTLICRLPTVGTVWKALSEVAEQTPVLYFLIARAVDQLLGPSDLAVRLVSVLAFGAALLVTFDSARRLADGPYGLIAMSFLATPFVAYYGHEARSYSLYLLLAAVALWLWNFAAGKAGLLAFGFTFLAGVGIHYYFVLCLAPFAVAAAIEKQYFHPKLTAGAAGALISLAALYPQIATGRRFAQSISAVWQPSPAALLKAYVEILPLALFLFAVFAAGSRMLRRHDHATLPMSPAERAGWIFLVLPVLAFLVGVTTTHVFHDRYAIGAAPGIAIAASSLIWRHYGKKKTVSTVLVLCACGIAIAQQWQAVRRAGDIRSESGDYQEDTRRILALEDTLLAHGKRHIVFNWDVRYLEVWHYSKHPEAYECVTAEKRWALQRYVPLRFVFVDDIVARSASSALIAPSPELADALRRAGLRLVPRFSLPQPVYYIEERVIARPAISPFQ
jgi:hypothetical protein